MTLTYDFDLARFDFAAIHAWMASTYWSEGISRERVERGFRASALCVGAFQEGKQVGVARCVSDTTRFAYVADVFVDEAYRRQGIARQMVREMMAHPLLSDVDSWYLITQDAQGVYAEIGFTPITNPERFMVYRNKKNA
jgi:N-acetylglutamate synthase-like GNAT family acetyltransferase